MTRHDGGERRGGRAARRKLPNVADELKRGQNKLVQVTKEPIGTKGPASPRRSRLPAGSSSTCRSPPKSASPARSTTAEQRAKLREMVGKLVPKDSGGMDHPHRGRGPHRGELQAGDRSAARPVEEDQAQGVLRAARPALVQRETSLTRGIIRDLFSDKVDTLFVDSKLLHNEIVAVPEADRPELLEPGQRSTGDTPLFDEFDIEAEIREPVQARGWSCRRADT